MGVSLVSALLTDHPVIIEHPPHTIDVDYGDEVSMKVVADGPDLTYQWYFFGWEIPDRTEDELYIGRVRDWDEGQYKCVVRDSRGKYKVTSHACNLKLTGMLYA